MCLREFLTFIQGQGQRISLIEIRLYINHGTDTHCSRFSDWFVAKVLVVHQQDRNQTKEVKHGPQNQFALEPDEFRLYDLTVVTLEVQEESSKCVTDNEHTEEDVYLLENLL